MRYFDPARPKYGDGPLYADAPAGRNVALPSLYVDPGLSASGEIIWTIHVWMAISAGSYRGFSTELTNAELAGFFAEWLEDPERALRERFGYTFDLREFNRKAHVRRTATAVAQGLAALGLD